MAYNTRHHSPAATYGIRMYGSPVIFELRCLGWADFSYAPADAGYHP